MLHIHLLGVPREFQNIYHFISLSYHARLLTVSLESMQAANYMINFLFYWHKSQPKRSMGNFSITLCLRIKIDLDQSGGKVCWHYSHTP
jgi:hypothetical protein